MGVAADLTVALHKQLAKVESSYLAYLVRGYEAMIGTLAQKAGKQFALTAAATPDWQPPADGAIITVAEVAAVANRLTDKLEPIWEQVVVDTAQAPLATIEIGWDVKHPLAQSLLDQAGKRTGARLGEAVQYTLRETLAHAYDNGLDVRVTSKLIQQKITDAAPFQADMLARTDLNSLANGASKAAAQLAGVGYKTWLSALLPTTRQDHAEAHGQTVAINDTFTVGGEDMDYPGDPAGSDANVCNCVCTVAYGDTLGEAEGLISAASSPNLTAVHHALSERLAAKIAIASPDECWLWTAAKRQDGYGQVWDSTLKKPDVAHRVVFRALKGPIPDGMTLDHLCRNRACVNPAHLEIVSRGENVMRGIGFGPANAAKTHCDHGHEFTEANTYFRPDGYRDCRECKRLRQRAYLERSEMASIRQRTKKRGRRAAHQHGDALVAAAIPIHHTAVTDPGSWDGNAALGRCSSAADFRSISAWVDSSGDPSERQSYRLPHHDRPGGPANIVGVRNALSRLPQATTIPDGDKAGARAHLEAHLNDFNKNKAALIAAPQPVRFNGTAAIEGQIADDNSMTPRVLLPQSLSWPEMPLSFMAQTATAEGHDGAEVAGRVDEFARKKMMGKKQSIYTAGELTNEFGINEIAPMIENKTMRYVSADLGATEWCIVGRADLGEVPMDDLNLEDLQAGKYALGLTSGKMKALTLLPTQALEGAMVALVASAEEHGIAMSRLDEEDTARLVTLLASAGQATDDGPYYRVVVPVSDAAVEVTEALVASPAPRDPPRAWFETQEPPGKMPLTVTKEGRIYGHLATWDSCHASFLPQCVPPPKSPSNYARFHTGYIDVEDGGEITVGKLMFSPADGGHADRRLTAAKASAYYDKTGMAAAVLRATDGKYGVWVAGSLNPKLSDKQREEMRRELRLNPPSGDWRVYDGQYDLLCGLAVAIPGFGVIPSAEVSIVASADGVELRDAIIASSGWFEPDGAAVAAMEHLGLVDEDVLAERRLQVLAARAQGLDALAALVE